MEKNEARLTISVPTEAKAELERIAAAEGRPSANLARLLIIEGLQARNVTKERS